MLWGRGVERCKGEWFREVCRGVEIEVPLIVDIKNKHVVVKTNSHHKY